MTNIKIAEIPASACVCGGLIAAMFLTPSAQPQSSARYITRLDYARAHETFGGQKLSLPLLFRTDIETFGLADFYAQFAAKQEPLGSEFEKVLYDNLWELYAR